MEVLNQPGDYIRSLQQGDGLSKVSKEMEAKSYAKSKTEMTLMDRVYILKLLLRYNLSLKRLMVIATRGQWYHLFTNQQKLIVTSFTYIPCV